MSARFTAFALSVAFLFAPAAWAFGPETAPSQSPAPVAAADPQLAASVAWSNQFRGIINDIVAPLQATPQPPSLAMNDDQRHAWATGARAWATGTRRALEGLRPRVAQLPPPPPTVISPTLQSAEASAAARLPQVLDSIATVADSLEEVSTAIEQHRDDAVIRARVSGLDATLILVTLFRDTNANQADAISAPNPQHFFLHSCAAYYDAFVLILQFKRGVMLQTAVDRQALATALISAGRDMRTDAQGGRLGAAQLRSQLAVEAASNAQTAASLPRLQAILDSFLTSFDREERMAAELDAMAALLRDPRDFVVVEADFDRHMRAFGDMDTERATDVNRRAELFSGP